MKRYFLLIFIFYTISAIANQQTEIQDSLQQALPKTITKQERLETLTNLMDNARKETIIFYAKQLLDEAQKANDEYHKEAALTELLRYYVNRDIKDSTNYYLDIANRELSGESRESLVSFIKTIQDTRIIYYTDGDERKQLIKNYFLKLETEKNMSPYEQISANYILGMSIANNVLVDLPKEHIKQIYDYFGNVISIAEKLPLRYSYYLQPNSYHILCNYTTDLEKRTQYATRYLNLLHNYANTKEIQKRPYAINKRHLLNAYNSLCTGSQFIGKDLAASYYQKFLDIIREYPEEANLTPEFEMYYTSSNYYSSIGDYQKYIDYCDSLIAFYKKSNLDENIIACVEGKVSAYDSLKMYKEAFDTYKEYTILLDTLHHQQMAKELEGLEIQKEVNNLIIEKKELELKFEKSKSLGYSLLALLLIAFSITLYILFRLGKIKVLYKELQESNRLVTIASEKAQESERMKNAFIKNMCHEVRTPLNAINGFSELVASESTSNDEKKEFCQIIYQNCHSLTVMMNNVLEIAQLDSNKDEIELVPTHIYPICLKEMEKQKEFLKKEGIEYIVEGNLENDTILTNPTYFSVLIQHLLSNANKFTENGSITLSYELNTDTKTATICITDTGCGIEPDKREWIFERFTKGNDFIPGSGLGLYLCRIISERLKGNIYVNPDYTEGACFILTLPI